MIPVFLSTVLFCPCNLTAPIAPLEAAASIDAQAAQDAEVDAKIAAAGRDVKKLNDAAKFYASSGKPDAAKKVWKKVLEIDTNNETAHKGLNHTLYDKKWFESAADVAQYKKDEVEKPKGMARWNDQWVPEGDVPFLKMGWTKDEKGAWNNPVEMARLKQLADWRTEHYQFRPDDNSWIAPADTDKWAKMQWKCGNDWVDTAKANEFHSKLGQWWELDGAHFVTWTTCDWEGGHLARWHADFVYPEMERLFGVTPESKPHYVILNSLDQYNQAAGGQTPLLPDSEGISSLHGAYFADSAFDYNAKPPQFQGAGICYWDRKDAKLKPWGLYWLRWAAAQSYVDAIDPSWVAIGDRIAAQQRGEVGLIPAPAFWGEKKIPRWLRYGAASYAERFMKNPEASKGGDPWDLRTFAFAEIKKAGGLHKLDEVFAFTLDLNKAENSTRLYHEAGLLVSFLLDGSEGNKDLAKKHEAFKTALKSGTKADVAAAADALQKELVKNEPKIKKFAGL